MQADGIKPDLKQISKELGLDVEKIKQVLKITKEPISLDAPIGGDEDGRFGDFVTDTKSPTPIEAIMNLDLEDQIDQVLDLYQQ